MNVAGEELELVARGAGVTAEVGLGEVEEDGTQGGEPEDGRGNRQRRCHSRTNPIVGVVTKFRLLIDRADSLKRCYRRLSPSPFYLAFRIKVWQSQSQTAAPPPPRNNRLPASPLLTSSPHGHLFSRPEVLETGSCRVGHCICAQKNFLRLR